MENSSLFCDLSEESRKLMDQFIHFNPVGSMVLTGELEVISVNDSLKNYFGGRIQHSERYFGNIFNCLCGAEGAAPCGTHSQCGNCRIRNSMVRALEENRVIKNVQLNKEFIIGDRKTVKWFDITLVPIEVRDQRLLWVSMIDLTELMKYKIDFEMGKILDEEARALEKDAFHESVMNCIRTNCYTGGVAHLTLIELRHARTVQESFGSLWRNDYIASFHDFLSDHTTEEDSLCRYSAHQFLVFTPCKEDEEHRAFVERIKDYQYKFFNALDGVACRTVKFKMDTENVRDVVNSDVLHIEYFKSITHLERLSEGDVYELSF